MIDVCLLLEGSYPYVAGGVSTWVHELISTMKNIRFGIVFLGAAPDPTRTLKYEIPNHVIYFKEIYLHDYNLTPYRKRDPNKNDYLLLEQFYEEIFQKKYDLFPEFARRFRGEECCFDLQTFFSSEEVWNLLKKFYNRYGEESSFIDFFWTWRGTHLPLLQVLSGLLPAAKIYHSVSTGYAGLLGSIVKSLYGKKFLLTEHGIYTHERLLEISQASWIYEKEKKNFRAAKDLSLLKRWWIAMFQAISRLTYQNADQIYTLFEGNKIREMAEGADPDKISLIPNGIDLKLYGKLSREKKKNKQIGFIGRVVSIKDVKTFIQAAKMVLQNFPSAQFYIVGPTDEEPFYFEECQRMVETLHLDNHISFTGRVSINDYYRFLDVVVLTSLSEAQPYVILEANACGIPVVATDVGDCRGLLEGKDSRDRALGHSGIITAVSHPEQTAAAICRLLEEPTLTAQMEEAGKKRTKNYYDVEDLRSRYLNIYEQNL
ncbi:MAG: GT4 family glycosyltransferase PelF [Deltaproteobacteria bacterium]|nr:GT4 family glycosyltransferase PelF [Deltaproteobacteria bacterium]